MADADAFPAPVQRPHPPLLIGGGRDQLLSIPVREADIVGLQMSSTAHGVNSNPARLRLAETAAAKVQLLRETAGARFSELELSIVATVTITDQREQEAERLAAARGWTGLSVRLVLDMPSVLIGSAGHVADEIVRRRERHAISYFVLSDKTLDAVTPIVSRLAGR